jgi:hypothetical protein
MKERTHRRAAVKLTERQRHWLKHIRTAERKDEPLTVYAEQQGLSVSSLYEAKRHLRETGVIAAASGMKKPKQVVPEFVPVSVREPVHSVSETVLRVRLSSGALLEWSEAPQGKALRELVGMLS